MTTATATLIQTGTHGEQRQGPAMALPTPASQDVPEAFASPLSGIYFVRARATRLVKIGFSDVMAARLANLQHHCADMLDLVAIIPSPELRWFEQTLHKEFNKLRRHGEWFAPGKKLAAYLDSLRDPPDPDEDEDPFEIVRRDAWIYDKLSLYEMNGGKRGKSKRANLEAALWAGRFVPIKVASPPHLTPTQQWRADYRELMAMKPITDADLMAVAEQVQAYRDASRLAPSMKRETDD